MIALAFGLLLLFILWTMCAALGWGRAGAIAVGMWAVLWGLVHNGWLGYAVVGGVLIAGMVWFIVSFPALEAWSEEEERKERGW